jgi:hypothetical protein
VWIHEAAFVGRAKSRSDVPAHVAAGALRFARPTIFFWRGKDEKRGLIDASSRIYDMNTTAPMQNEGRMAEPKSFADS